MKSNRITSAGHSSNTLVSGRPVRIQRSRQTKQFSPNGLYIKYVGRPSIWGNPFKVTGEDGHWFIVKNDEPLVSFKEKKDAIEQAVMFFEDYIKGSAMNTLRGKNLSCWCKIGDPCHADVLLKLANR